VTIAALNRAMRDVRARPVVPFKLFRELSALRTELAGRTFVRPIRTKPSAVDQPVLEHPVDEMIA